MGSELFAAILSQVEKGRRVVFAELHDMDAMLVRVDGPTDGRGTTPAQSEVMPNPQDESKVARAINRISKGLDPYYDDSYYTSLEKLGYSFETNEWTTPPPARGADDAQAQ